MKTVLIVVGAVLLVQLTDWLMRRPERKATGCTLLTLLDGLADLAARQGYPSWIAYLEAVQGKEQALYFINRLYAVLERNKTREASSEAVRSALQNYLRSQKPKTKGAAK